jgi:uncharacterized protein (DUF58 family)
MTLLRSITIIAIVWMILDPNLIIGMVVSALIGVQVTGWAWPRFVRNQISWQRSVPSALAPAEQADVVLRIVYRGWLPLPYLIVREDIPASLSEMPRRQWVVSLRPGQQCTLRYPIQGRQRGLYWLGPLKMWVGSVFAINEVQLGEPQQTPLTIVPMVLPFQSFYLPNALPYSQERYHLSLFDDPAQKIGVRQYQTGDPPRRIDWKTSARVGELQVRELAPVVARETLIVLAFMESEYPGRFSYNNRERAVVAAASLAAALIYRRQPVGFQSNGYDPLLRQPVATLAPAAGVEHLREILLRLGRIEPATDGAPIDHMLSDNLALSRGGTLVLITSSLNACILAILLTIRRSGIKVSIALADPGPTDLLQARQHGITAFQINRDGAIVPDV